MSLIYWHMSACSKNSADVRPCLRVRSTTQGAFKSPFFPSITFGSTSLNGLALEISEDDCSNRDVFI